MNKNLVSLQIAAKHTSLRGNFRPEIVPALVAFMQGCIVETRHQRMRRPRKPKPERTNAEIAAAVLRQLKRMTPAERVQTLVDAGICQQDGTLNPSYTDQTDAR